MVSHKSSIFIQQSCSYFADKKYVSFVAKPPSCLNKQRLSAQPFASCMPNERCLIWCDTWVASAGWLNGTMDRIWSPKTLENGCYLDGLFISYPKTAPERIRIEPSLHIFCHTVFWLGSSAEWMVDNGWPLKLPKQGSINMSFWTTPTSFWTTHPHFQLLVPWYEASTQLVLFYVSVKMT